VVTVLLKAIFEERVIEKGKNEDSIFLWELFLNSAQFIIFEESDIEQEKIVEKKSEENVESKVISEQNDHIICITPSLCLSLISIFLLEKKNSRISELLSLFTNRLVLLITKIDSVSQSSYLPLRPGGAYLLGFLLQLWLTCILLFTDVRENVREIKLEENLIENGEKSPSTSWKKSLVTSNISHLFGILPPSLCKLFIQTGLWEQTKALLLSDAKISPLDVSQKEFTEKDELFCPIYFHSNLNSSENINAWRKIVLLNSLQV
jgi:hypothetical protein